MDYSNDSIYKVSRMVSQMALRNIQPVVPPADDSATPAANNGQNTPSATTNSNTSSSLLTMKHPNQMVNSDSNIGKAYEDFMKGANALNNELEEMLTDLDNQYEEVEYPTIDHSKKAKHNKNFERFYTGGTLSRSQLNGYTRDQLKDAHRQLRLPFSHKWSKEGYINSLLSRAHEASSNFLVQKYGSRSGSEESEPSEDSEAEPEDESEVISDGHLDYSDSPDSGSGDYSEAGSSSDDDSSVSSENSGNAVGPEPDSGDDMSSISDAPSTATVIGKASDPTLDYKSLSTTALKIIANQITNLQVIFSNSLKSNFKQLTQSKVNAISDIFDQIKPQVNELLSDEFIVKYHAPQVVSIRKLFDKLYTDVYVSTRSFVKKTTDGGYLDHRHHNNFAERYYL
jgi:hypothetical protein